MKKEGEKRADAWKTARTAETQNFDDQTNERKFLCMINSMTKAGQARPAAAHHSKGWTPERRARQAALIRRWQPWRRSTGPRSAAGKARIAMNALRHGCRSRAWLLRARRIRHAIRTCANTVLLARVLMRQRDRLPLPFARDEVRGLDQWQSEPRSCMRG